MLSTRAIAIAAAWLVAFFANTTLPASAGPGHGPGGHGHGGAAPVVAGHASPRVTAQSEKFELVGIQKDGRLVVYLDNVADTSPVIDARIELTVDGATAVAKPQIDGTYIFEAGVLEKAGEKEVIAVITRGKTSDLLAGVLKDPSAGHDHDSDGSAARPESGPAISLGLPDSIAEMIRRASVPVMVGVGLAIGLLIGVIARRRVAIVAGFSLVVLIAGVGGVAAGPGHDHGHGAETAGAGNGDAPRRQPDGTLFLPKPTQRLLEIRTRILKPETARHTRRLIGRVIADPNRSGLVQGTIGGRIKAPTSGLPVLGQRVKLGQVLAYVEPAFEPIDASDVRQTAGEIDQRITLLKARIRRIGTLVKKQFASAASLEDLKIELAGLEARRAQLMKSRVEPEVLVAPVDGVIADVQVAAGQVVGNSQVLFRIVDPASLWVEAISFDPKIGLGAEMAKAIDGEGQEFPLTFVGRSRALQQQSTVLQFRIEAPPETLSIGTPVKVLIETGAPVTGLLVPRNAIAQAPNGQMVVFKRLKPERYEPVPVRVEDFDGSRVLVASGLSAGDQIIVRNAPLVNQIR